LTLSLTLSVVSTTFGSDTIYPHDQILIGGFSPEELDLSADRIVDIEAPSAYLVTRGGTVLWAKNADERRAIASITKVMTAIIALESGRLDEEATVSYEAYSVGGSTAGYEVGEVHTLTEMLEAMLSVSGNDAAVAIAEHLGGTSDAFAILMNDKARELGMNDTHFTNPQGFDDEGTDGFAFYDDDEVTQVVTFGDDGHFSTATDVARMATYAMGIQRFREIVANPGDETSPYPNTNELLSTFAGANGIKTGMTDAAGNCVAASALRDDIELYAVVLGTDSEQARFDQAAELLEFGFAHYAHRVLMQADTVLGDTAVSDYLDVNVEVGIAHEVAATYYDLFGPIEQFIDIEPIKAPVEIGTVVGFITFTQNDEVLASEPIVSFEAVEKPGFFEAISIALTRFWRSLTGYETARHTPALRGNDLSVRYFEGDRYGN
jgi:D-alanyl-D-alanine carboxypeptidase (penicillin-binding protein 5/6)